MHNCTVLVGLTLSLIHFQQKSLHVYYLLDFIYLTSGSNIVTVFTFAVHVEVDQHLSIQSANQRSSFIERQILLV
jgi:hypothetical protein